MNSASVDVLHMILKGYVSEFLNYLLSLANEELVREDKDGRKKNHQKALIMIVFILTGDLVLK